VLPVSDPLSERSYAILHLKPTGLYLIDEPPYYSIKSPIFLLVNANKKITKPA